MQTWYEFYKNRSCPSYFEYFQRKYSPFLIELNLRIYKQVKLTNRNKTQRPRVAEFGCGIGTVTRILQNQPYSNYVEFYAMDICSDMLNLCGDNTENVRLIQHDITKPIVLPKMDVIHSHGVLEHFQDEQIRQIIKNQKRLCNTLVHYVPSNEYKEPSFGDERLMSPDEWFRIAKPDSILLSNDKKDLVLIWD